jgi:hypothetical protein
VTSLKRNVRSMISDRSRGVLVPLVVLTLQGCLAQTIKIAVTESPSEKAPSSVADTEAVLAVAADVAERFGLAPNPALPTLQQHSETSSVWTHRLLVEYSREPEEETRHGRIVLWVGASKTSSEMVVVIRDLRHGSSTRFTEAVENAVVEALASRFPTDQIHVTREKDLLLGAP